jgi:hypothetical protein
VNTEREAGPAPPLRILTGRPTDDEVAALVAVLVASAAGNADAPPVSRVSGWAVSGWVLSGWVLSGWGRSGWGPSRWGASASRVDRRPRAADGWRAGSLPRAQ